MDDDDAIAIVGLGGKFPGAANKDEFWKVLVNGENHVNDIPPQRWNKDAFYSSDPNTPGKTYVQRAGLLKSHDGFDHRLFNISEIEAERMDPQQRYVLECVHMALEDGGITRKMINGSDTGVFIGCMNNDFKETSSDDLKTATNYSLTGASSSIIAARVSYVYNLLGPSMTIDTACSSALVAIDTAIQNLVTGRCSMTICGGVNSILTPNTFIPLSRARMVSPTGQCQAFSDKADGYARGEGCGIIILKKLGDMQEGHISCKFYKGGSKYFYEILWGSRKFHRLDFNMTIPTQAKRDRNNIWATIATDCNQDGHTASPITAPSGIQQEELLRRIYNSQNVEPRDIQVIEAHGTGTPVGDPIEANALGRFFGQDESQSEKMYIASVKTNIGHLESAAGVASLIKVLLMMKNKTVVPSLHFSTSNAKIDFGKYGFVVPTSTISWKSNRTVGRLACVNSFGFGGTNSHAIIKEYISTDYTKQFHTSSKYHLVFISAVDVIGLRLTLSEFARQIESTSSKLSDVSFTSICGRDHFQHRVAFVTTDFHDLKNKCIKREQCGFNSSTVRRRDPHIVAVFCGVGTNWNGMCSQLLKEESIIEKTVLEIDKIISKSINWSIFDFLSTSQDLSDPLVAHITIFACQVALWRLWEYWGITVDAVVGQSVGEVAAAYAAGCLTLEQAVEVIFQRSKILSSVTGGQMFVVGNCQTEHVEAVCKQFQEKACIAVYSSSSSCTVSCDSDIVDELKCKIKEGLSIEKMQKLFMKDLKVQCAYHSHHTGDAGDQLERSLPWLQGETQSKPIVSTVSGREASGKDFTDPYYWKQNVSRPVRFKDAILRAGSNNFFNIFLEIGPKPVLHAHLPDLYSEDEAVCLPSIKQNSESDTLMHTAAKLFEHGVNLNWKNVNKIDGSLVSLPRYISQPTRKLYLSDATRLKNQGIKQNSGLHLFVEKAPGAGSMFKININEADTPFVFEHFVSNVIIVPGALYAEVALAVVQSISANRIQDITLKLDFIRPIELSKGQSYSADVLIDDLSIHERNCIIQKDKDLIATFSFKPVQECFNPERIDLDAIRQICFEFQSADETYATLRKFGFTYGKDLMILGDAFKNDHQCIVQMHVSDAIWADIKTTHLHPAILDGLFQTPGVLQNERENDKTLLPAGIGEFRFRRGPERHMIGYAEHRQKYENEVSYNMRLLTFDGGIIAEVNDFKMKYVTDSSMNNSLEYAIAWERIDQRRNGYDSETQNPKTEKFLVWSFNNSLLSNIRGEYKDNEVSCFLLYQHNTLETQQNIIRSNLKNDPSIKNLCFAPGLTLEELEPGSTVLDAIRSTCIVMTALSQILVEYTPDVNLIAVTENTQVRDSNNLTLFNIFGSELWGQVRSILLEHNELDICLLDCQPSVMAALGFIAELFINRVLFNYTELIFADGKLFRNKLVQTDSHRQPIFRSTWLNECTNVEIKAKYPNDVTEVFCVLQPSENISKTNTTLIAVQSACLHNVLLYPTTFQDGNSFALPGSNDYGYHVLTFESIANVIKGPIRDLSGGSMQLEPVMVVACFPMKIQSIVSVPSSCVHSLNNLPGYKPGMMLIAILMRSLVDYIKKGESVNILCDKGDILPGHILQLMLKTSKKCNVRVITEQLAITAASKLIPLKACEISEMIASVESGSITSVLSLSTFIRYDMRMMLEAHDIDVISVQADDILCKRNLMKLNPEVFKFMTKHMSVLNSLKPENKQYESVIHIPCKTLSLKFEDIKKYKSMKIPTNMPFRRDCCYIVIGGMTGLGWELVKLLASHNAGEVISFSRREIDPSKRNELQNLRDETGCQIRTFATDITNFKSLQKTFQLLEHTSTRKIKGIFQGAGVLRDTFSTKMNESQLLEVLKPKVLGTWNLHLLTQKYSLDYFVMHSSITSVMGNIGQSNYAAANAFMDGFAYYRRLNKLCGQSINWGPLAVGMATDNPRTVQLFQDHGYSLLSVSEITTCFLNVLHFNNIQVIIGKFDWHLIMKSMSAKHRALVRQRFSNLQLQSNDGSRKLDDLAASYSSSDELVAITHALGSERITNITRLVLKTASEAFTTDNENLDEETFIQQLGIDSMQAMTFSNRLNELTGIRISFLDLMSDKTTLGTIINMLDETITTVAGTSMSVQLVDSYVQQSMTPPEKRAYDAYLLNPNDPSLFSFVDLSVSHALADLSIWRHITEQVQIKHGALRTVFIPDQDGVRYGVRKQVINSTDATMDIVIVAMQEFNNDKIPNDMTHYLFDPSKDFPMRILFATENDECIVRIVFNHLLIDLTSIWIVVNDMKAIKDSTPLSIQPDLDIAVIYEQKLQPQREKQIKYWKENTPLSVLPMSFTSATDVVLNPKYFSFTNLQIKSDIILNLTKFFSSQNLKLFDVIVSLYQLLLHLELEQDIITLFAIVDMRIHFPELRNTICRFTNNVPLYVELEDNGTVISFMKNNKKSLAGAIENSLLPFDAITELIENIEPSKVFRHQFIMEPVETSSYHENMINVKRISTGAYYNETVLYIWHNLEQNYLKLELGYSTLMIDEPRAVACLNRLSHFIVSVINNPHINIKTLINTRDEGVNAFIDSNRGSDVGLQNDDSPENIFQKEMYMLDENSTKDIFHIEVGKKTQKKTKTAESTVELLYQRWTNADNEEPDSEAGDRETGMMQTQILRGQDHAVLVSICKTKAGHFLQWRGDKNNLLGTLPLENVEKVEMIDNNEQYNLQIHAQDRVYTFKTTDYNVASKLKIILTRQDIESTFPTVPENESA